MMRWIVPAAFVLAALTLSPLPGSTAHADPYKWCAYYGGRFDAGPNCGFLTHKQCLETISGISTARCEPNQFYDGRPFADEYSRPQRGRHRR